MKKSLKGWGFYIVLILIVVLVWYFLDTQNLSGSTYNYSQFEEELKDNEIVRVEVHPNRVVPTGRLDIVKADGSEETLYVPDVNRAQDTMQEYRLSLIHI
ncbi:MAG: ATP-dependent metallopeptidase FtsH/Yme1/Tma family protein, partial [Lachnospiraceae bacterium]|nr:ATP-dependent metallopeptidase FtsH/Yme1/Tma family protein [Lachnospiraceae bacterium]